MSLIKQITDYIILPVSTRAEYIPSMSEHESHKDFIRKNGLENFDSGIAHENQERKKLHSLIQTNYNLHGDISGIAIPKDEITSALKDYFQEKL